MTPTEWRQKHPRCLFCKHYARAWELKRCVVKQKTPKEWVPRWICKWQGLYEVRK